MNNYYEDDLSGFAHLEDDAEYASSLPPALRPSTALNEDDYDYAIELTPDDEYRQAAEALHSVSDFDDEDLFLGTSHSRYKSFPPNISLITF